MVRLAVHIFCLRYRLRRALGSSAPTGRERVFIRHEPSAASVGQAAELGIAEFLIRSVYGPEHLELLRVIGTPVDQH